MASGVRLSEVASGVLTTGSAVCGAPAGPIVGAEGRFISVGISKTLFCLLAGHDARRRGRVMTIDQMVVAVKHALRLKAARSVKCFENTDKDILAFNSLSGRSFNIAHR
jgi:hypothetical protein